MNKKRPPGISEEIPKSLKIKAPKTPSSLLANSRETAEAIPPAANPTQVQVAPRTVPAETRAAGVATRTLPDRTEFDNWKFSLKLRMLFAESEKFTKLGRTVAHLVEFAERLIDRDVSVEMDELHSNFGYALLFDRKVLRCDVAVCPVVLSSFNCFLHALVIIDQ